MYKGSGGANDLLDHVNRNLKLSDAREKQNIAFWVVEEITGMNRAEILADKPVLLNDHRSMQLSDAVARLNEGEPVQYVFGRTWFRGLELKVDENVLIPRPETEELVELILKENGSDPLSVLDVGTGSGCIAVSLAIERQGWKIVGLDISGEALRTAAENAHRHGVRPAWLEMDILKEIPDEKFDLIVSNPPYIPEREKPELQVNVRDHEPGLALFVANNDPLTFYRRIAGKAAQILKRGGNIYFEVHFEYGPAVVDLLAGKGYTDIFLHQDLNGRDRMVRATWAGTSGDPGY